MALSQKCSSLPNCYCRYFWALLCLLICSSLGFYCQVFSLHLYVQSTELKMQKLITLRLLCVDEHSLWGPAVCGSFQHHGQTNLWPEKLGGCPPQSAWSTCQRHRAFPGASRASPAAAQSQTCDRGAGRKNALHINLASTFSDLTALTAWQSWQNLTDVEPYSQPPDRHF